MPPLFPPNDFNGIPPLFPSGGRGGRDSSFASQNRASNADSLREKILCAFEKNGIQRGPSNEWARATYAADHLSDILSRMDPRWQDIATRHMIAQAVAETGGLRWLSELKSRFASSWSKFKGRGLMMTTHKSNYAKLAGCADTLSNYPSPQTIAQESIARSPALYQSPLVVAPDKIMSESTQEGQRLQAISLICYMVDTAERHPRFEAALKCAEPRCVREVGVGVNQGPGNLGKGRVPHGDKARIEAFRKAGSCFPGTESGAGL